MSYIAPFWLPGGQLQTLYPASFIAKPVVNYRRERWDTPDGDFIDVDFIDGVAGCPFVLLFHGLEGSSDSHYARAMMAAVAERGWSGAVPHFRGCSGEINRGPRFYHSGDSAEIDWIVKRLRTRFLDKFYATGISLGANVLLRWLGEYQHQAEIIDGACAISAPHDLAQSGATLSKGFSRFYTWMFLQSLKPKCVKKLQQFPGLFDGEKMLRATDLHEFDDVVTAPVHGYLNADDYWSRASAKHVINDITLPTLVLNARNDPFLPSQYLPTTASPSVVLEYSPGGGHAGFAIGPWPGRISWLSERAFAFFDADSK